jgi:hypothetical protein
VSDDGLRAAVTEFGNLVTVYDLTSRASLGSVRVPNARRINSLFVTNDLIRIYDHDEQIRTRIFEYDVANKSFRQTGEAAVPFWRFNADKTRTIAYWKRPDITIYDARTGQVVMTIPIKAATAKFLKDGRIAAIDERNVLQIFAADGAPIRSIALPAEPVAPMLDIGGGLVVVVVKMRPTDLVIDINRGAVVRTESGLLPAYNGQGSLLLCSNKAHDLIVWNPATGEKRVVLKRS